VTGVSVLGTGQLKVTTTGGSAIVFMEGAVDESSLNGNVATVGPSGGIHTTTFMLRDYEGKPVHARDPDLYCSTCNIQLEWVRVRSGLGVQTTTGGVP
jgi:hypothetical protein